MKNTAAQRRIDNLLKVSEALTKPKKVELQELPVKTKSPFAGCNNIKPVFFRG